MEIIFIVKPERDSYNTDPEEIEFTVRGNLLEIVVGDRVIAFAKEDMLKIARSFEL